MSKVFMVLVELMKFMKLQDLGSSSQVFEQIKISFFIFLKNEKGYTQNIWITTDGKNYQQYSTSGHLFFNIIPHPSINNYILAQGMVSRCYNYTLPGFCHYDLLLSKDQGKTWKLVEEYVWLASWGIDLKTDVW